MTELLGLGLTALVIAVAWLLVRRYEAHAPQVDWTLIERNRRAEARRREERKRPRVVTRWIFFLD
jgi:hypothetical protein